jgi:curved DNA-binding protein CbpA
MIKKIEDLSYYELLEVSPTATAQEIHKAYERIRRVYEPNSIALYSLFTPEETAIIHQRIEEAYRTLVYEDNRKQYDAMLRDRDDLPELSPPPPAPSSMPKYQTRPAQPVLPLQSENRHIREEAPPRSAPPQAKLAQEEVSHLIAEFTGPALKALRELRGLSIKDIADTTKVGSRYLECIEEEMFAKLPARPYLRGFLGLYAKTLGYEPERVISDYLKRYDAAMNLPKK